MMHGPMYAELFAPYIAKCPNRCEWYKLCHYTNVKPHLTVNGHRLRLVPENI